MTRTDLPDHGARPAPPSSGYEPGSTLPPHLGGPMVIIERLQKFFGTNHVLRGVDLEVREREAVMIIGRSGSGKTTLLRCINFLEEPTAGSIEIDGLRHQLVAGIVGVNVIAGVYLGLEPERMGRIARRGVEIHYRIEPAA